MSNQNLPWHSLRLSSCPVIDYPGQEPDPHLATASSQGIGQSDKVRTEPPPSTVPHSTSQPQTFPQRDPSLGPFLSVLSELRGPDPQSPCVPHQCRAQGENHTPCPSTPFLAQTRVQHQPQMNCWSSKGGSGLPLHSLYHLNSSNTVRVV